MAVVAGLIFLACLVLYGVLFAFDQHLRVRKGPWSLTFTNEPTGEASVIIRQDHLGVKAVRLIFQGEKTVQTNGIVRFDGPVESLPFGRLIYFDTTYLPGALTFNFFGHGVELSPRVLTTDWAQRSWEPETVVVLKAGFKRQPKPPDRRKGPKK